jgi:GT2 family glycosyltransferase
LRNRSLQQRRVANLPPVSVVVLNFNGKEYLKECFTSLEGLKYPSDKLELVMVDNGSSDGSYKYMKAHFPAVELICNERNLGFAEGNNIGARHARGDYVAFLNNDMRVHADWLIELVKTVSGDKEVVCTGGKILSWDGKKVDFVGGTLNFYGMGFQPEHGSPYRETEYSEQREILFACGGSMLIKRDVFLGCGGFDEDYFAYFEDVDLGWRLWLLGYEVVFAPRAISYHLHQATARKLPDEKKAVLYERNALASIIKNYSQENLDRILPAALLLTAKRMMISSGLDKRSYSLEGKVEAEEELITQQRPSPNDPPHVRFTRGRKTYGLIGLGKEVMRRTLSELFIEFRRRDPRSYEILPRSSLSYLVAMDDLIEALPRLMEKRRQIQAARKRSDAEIFKLFGTPFHPHPPLPDYEETQNSLANCLGITQIFQKSSSGRVNH